MPQLFFLNEEAGKFVENISVLHKWDEDDCKRRMEAASLFVILKLVGQRKFYFYQGSVREF